MNFKEWMLSFLIFFLLMIMVLISVAFLTLFERKILGYMQVRKGPNKVGFLGILQPFSDAIKLFTKEQVNINISNKMIFLYSPMINMMLMVMVWISIPFFFINLKFEYSIMFFFVVSGISVYSIMLAGWSSNSSYAMLGSLRSIAQVVSYEVFMFLLFLSLIVLVGSLDFLMFIKFQKKMWFLLFMMVVVIIMYISMLAETNRTPFDLAEGESELVSGFNIEFSGVKFALIFMAEYSMIIFMSFIFSLMMLGGDLNSLMFFLKVVILSFMWLWIRASLPRIRYDKLMKFCWKSMLPLSLILLVFYFYVKSMSVNLLF